MIQLILKRLALPLKTFIQFSLFIGAIMSTSCTPFAEAADFVEITREVVLEEGRSPVVKSMARTRDGGYVIVGSDQHIPWATRVDANGKVLWRHMLPMPEFHPGGSAASYESVASLDDDSVMLVGQREFNDKPELPQLGLFTRLDKFGKTVSQRYVHPMGNNENKVSWLRKCMPWGDGFVALGIASQGYREKRVQSLWLMALDITGGVKWDKLIPSLVVDLDIQPIVLPNQDIVLRGMGTIIVLDRAGTVKTKVSTGDPTEAFYPVLPGSSDSTLRILSVRSKPKGVMKTFDSSMTDIATVTGSYDGVLPNAVYSLSDGSIGLFGYRKEGPTSTAAIAKLSSDLRQVRSYMFRPIWNSYAVEAAVSTGDPNEFATIRSFSNDSKSTDPKRQGLVLSFIRIK